MLTLATVTLVLITLFFVLYILNKNKSWRNAALDFKYCALMSGLHWYLFVRTETLEKTFLLSLSDAS